MKSEDRDYEMIAKHYDAIGILISALLLVKSSDDMPTARKIAIDAIYEWDQARK